MSTNTIQEYADYLVEANIDDIKPITYHDFSAKRTIGFSNVLNKKIFIQPIVVTKSSIAKQIFDDGKLSGLARRDIIKLFEIDAGLTKAGAATYYANFMNQIVVI
jgi:hypothetical protein